MNRSGINFNFGNSEQPAIDINFSGRFCCKKAVNSRVSLMGNKAFFSRQDGFENIRR
ncbi:MAG: hypothetical protein ABFD76_17150 [Smithella sp.]